MFASRAPCPPWIVLLALMLMVGKAYATFCSVDQQCQRLCPPYRLEAKPPPVAPAAVLL
jgi:hypothetical protein